jgi:hypothetical protein
MRPERKLYSWPEIDEVPAQAGIYAWYYKHTLTDHDINALTGELAALQAGPSEEAMALVRRFLETHLFEAFVEEPYEAVIRGPLKPGYEGLLHNIPHISPGLVERIVADPGRLKALKKVLEGAIPEFASPIYIGMSDSLNRRLRWHQRLIAIYKEAGGHPGPDLPATPLERSDHSFARQVARRGFNVSRLVVAVRLIEAAGDIHLDAENILNRINYPLCGRN